MGDSVRVRIGLTEILVVERPDGSVFQVAGDNDGIAQLVQLIKLVPLSERGHGWTYLIEDDQVLENSDGREILRIPGGNRVYVPDGRKRERPPADGSPEDNP